ncbi:MAG: hypothetical protein HYW48_05705 [Deltaproteobacteria bacterium]|nr:hypothetical protein [Deltaproteobacteria bacterium]
MKLHAFIYVGILSLGSGGAIADPVMETWDRVETDWGNLRIRFHGDFKPTDQSEVPFVEAEQKAITDGLLYARGAIRDFHKKHYLALGMDKAVVEQGASLASDLVTHATYVNRSEVFKDGTVRVFLESSLPRALNRGDILFPPPPEVSTPPRFSGLILRLDKSVSPVAEFEIVDTAGSRLYGVEKLSKESFQNNLMGKWFYNPRREELLRSVGVKPVALEAKVVTPTQYSVNRGAWRDALEESASVLTEGKLAIVLPLAPHGN